MMAEASHWKCKYQPIDEEKNTFSTYKGLLHKFMFTLGLMVKGRHRSNSLDTSWSFMSVPYHIMMKLCDVHGFKRSALERGSIFCTFLWSLFHND